MALDTSVTELAPLLSAYEAAVAPAREAALESALRLGAACRSRASWLNEQLDTPSGVPEPRRIDGLTSLSCWEVACNGDPREPICALLRTLRTLYAHRLALKPYDYKGALQMQIDVSDDQVFFGWPLHILVGGAAPLYRGMVIQFDGKLAPPIDVALASAEATASLAAADPLAPPAVVATGSGGLANGSGRVPGARVIGLAKLKCLQYLIRTFGVRNLLPTLLDKGAPAYLAATERFFKNW